MNPFLTADYRDGRVRIDSKTYAAGAYAVHLLNQYYRNDTAARISVYKQYGWNVAEQLSAGYLKETDFISVGTEIGFILDTLPNLKPFSALDVIAERNRIQTCSPKITQSKLQISFTTVPWWKAKHKLSWIWICSRRNTIKYFSKKVMR